MYRKAACDATLFVTSANAGREIDAEVKTMIDDAPMSCFKALLRSMAFKVVLEVPSIDVVGTTVATLLPRPAAMSFQRGDEITREENPSTLFQLVNDRQRAKHKAVRIILLCIYFGLSKFD